MTELLVVLGIATVGFATMGYLLRWLLSRPTGDAEMNRVATLVRDAAEGFSRRQGSTIGALAAIVGGAVFLAYGLRHDEHGVVPPLELGVWITLSFAVGAASVVLLVRIATFTATRGAIRTAAAARNSTDEALRTTVRSGAIVGLAAGAVVALGLAGLVLAVLAHHGATGDQPDRALAVAPTLPWLLLGHPLGAGFAALLAQISGGTFSKSADVGADLGAREMGLEDDDPANPATIADLAGDCAGDCAARAAKAVAAASILDVAAMLVFSTVYARDDDLLSALSLVLVPVLSRAFSILGTAFGAFVVRTDDREAPLAPLARGLVVATLLHAVGTAGAVWWLVPQRSLAVLCAGAVGVVVWTALAGLTYLSAAPRAQPVRDVAEASRSGPPVTLLSGVVVGLDVAAIALVLCGGSIYAAWALGSAYGGPAGGPLGLASLAVGFAAASGFVVTLESAGAIVDAASGIVQMTVGRDRREVRGRLLVLDMAGTALRSLARIEGCTGALLGAALYVSALPRFLERLGLPAPVPEPGPGPYVAALLGVTFVAWMAARVIGGVSRSARRVLEEVRRQLRDRPLEVGASRRASGSTRAAPDRASTGDSPDHGPCVEMASRFALRQMVLPGLSAVVLPAGLSLALRLSQSGDKGVSAVDSVASLIVAATVAGVVGSLVVATAGGAWGNAKKYIVTGAHGGPLLVDETGARAENPTFHAAVVGDTAGDPLKDTAVPVVLVLVKMLPVLALVLLPLLW